MKLHIVSLGAMAGLAAAVGALSLPAQAAPDDLGGIRPIRDIAARPAPPAPAAGVTHMGMTWRTYPHNIPNGAVVGCNNKCDAYKGDTAATEIRPILCIVPGTSPEPASYAATVGTSTSPNAASSNWRFYYGWSGGQIGLSRPYRGSDLVSRAVADGFCKRDLRDNNARMAEHHDNKIGGWALGGTIHPRSNAKGLLTNGGKADASFWTAINDQPANPWS
jgi:hypothetical protein